MKIKTAFIFLILTLAIIFSYLTLESVMINTQKIYYCRQIEFWCKPSWVNNVLIYDAINDQYKIIYPTEIKNIEVKGGKFKNEENEEFVTNLEDGYYEQVLGFYNDDDKYYAFNDKLVALGYVL